MKVVELLGQLKIIFFCPYLEILRQHEEHMRIAEDLRRQLDNDMYYRDGGDRGDRLGFICL